MRGMIIQCVGCGCSKHIDLDGTPEKIEARCNETIQEGWRYEKSRDGYACPKCCKDGSEDKLYELYVGKLKKLNKANSYKHLIMDISRQLQEFIWLDRMLEG